ncbi:MAG: hypothetical protein RIR26_2595 [Pseudomonadota bacterium]
MSLASKIKNTTVNENHLGKPLYKPESWCTPIKLFIDVRREKKRIVAYCATNVGWIEFDKALKMTCQHEIDNARPVFPVSVRPYIRTWKDKEFQQSLWQRDGMKFRRISLILVLSLMVMLILNKVRFHSCSVSHSEKIVMPMANAFGFIHGKYRARTNSISAGSYSTRKEKFRK